MIIDQNIAPYLVFVEDCIGVALQRMNENEAGVVMAVTDSGILEGVMTTGDFRRWVLSADAIDLDQSISRVINRNFISVVSHQDPQTIQNLFSNYVQLIPMTDDYGRLVALARKRVRQVKIGDFTISGSSPTFTIAEIGNNHNGSLKLAKQLVDNAILAGADCAKFQMRQMSHLYHNTSMTQGAREDLGSQYTLDILSRFTLSNDELFAVFDYCHKKKIIPLCTPWDLESIDLLKKYGIFAYKVASADLTNHELLKKLVATEQSILLSTGMSSEDEFMESVALLKNHGAIYALLHCNSTYPAPFKDIHLKYMSRLREIGNCPVGYSGHERGFHVAISAVALGAKIIEKHFTLNRGMEGNDHKVSLLPSEFREMVDGIRQVEQALGSANKRHMSQGELMNREILAKSLIAKCDIHEGEIISDAMLETKSPGKGLQPNHRQALIGRSIGRNLKAGNCFYPSDLSNRTVVAQPHTFQRPWGLPVRFHDYQALMKKTNPDFLEFHLSYQDLNLDFRSFISKPMDMDFVIHCPELFSGDHTLDLCSLDAEYRHRSIKELQRVIALTRAMHPFFIKSKSPMIVTNVGGFTSDRHLLQQDVEQRYDILQDSLGKLDMEAIEIIPQTMPPFPWHFGGQRYHNLFVDVESITRFCVQNNMRICLDISHSKLACNHNGRSFGQFLESVGPHVAHMHFGDANGVDGEGLQIGKGEIDFFVLARTIKKFVPPSAGFIPEVWQGHKNDGEGFWVALLLLEEWFGASEK